MKKYIFIIFSTIALCTTIFTTGCSNDISNTDSLFYDSVREVAPSFSASAGTSSKTILDYEAQSSEWNSGNALYEIYYLFREFNPDTDQGVIDTSNLYKTMWESKNFLSRTISNCNSISEQTITPPFNFGNPATTYNCAYNKEASDGYDFGGAVKALDSNGNILPASSLGSTDAITRYGLFGFVWVDSDHKEYGSMQANVNSSTGDMSLDIVVWVNYEGDNDYCYRNDIDGNTKTHAFTLRAIKGNKTSNSYFISMVGKGYSQGEGKYFLLKVTDSQLNSKYFCIGAEDGEDELTLMDPQGSDTVDSNCAEYKNDVDAMTMFTTSDLACASSDFNPGGTGTASEGTIFLNFQ